MATDRQSEGEDDGSAGDGGAAGVAESAEVVLERPEDAIAHREREVLDGLRRLALRARVDRGLVVTHAGSKLGDISQ